MNFKVIHNLLLCVLQDLESHKNSLTDSIIGRLAEEIAAQKITQIAVNFMGFNFAKLESMEGSCPGDTWKYIVKVVTTWRNQTSKNNREVRKKLNLCGLLKINDSLKDHDKHTRNEICTKYSEDQGIKQQKRQKMFNFILPHVFYFLFFVNIYK